MIDMKLPTASGCNPFYGFLRLARGKVVSVTVLPAPLVHPPAARESAPFYGPDA